MSDDEKNKALRLNDIIPPFSLDAKPGNNAIPIEEIGPKKSDEQIPEFNLAEQILAEQRKVNSTKRKRPGVKNGGYELTKSQERAVERPMRVTLDTSGIIEDIVARDIRKLCTGYC